MHREATLVYPDGEEEVIDLLNAASDSELAPLFHHQGVLTYTRQKGVTKLEPLPDWTMAIKPKPKGFFERLLETLRLT